MTHEAIRENHYKRMNAYRNSCEYQEYAKSIGYAVDQSTVQPSLFGNRWEINEAIYWDFMEMLPPVYCKGGFYMIELTFDNITNKFTKEGEKYYCEFARIPSRKELVA